MKVAVIGGGISGLSAAYRLKKAGAAVALLEASGRVGGLLGTRRVDGFVIETGPDSILTEKPWAMELAEELGLGAEVIHPPSSPRGAYIVCRGKLERVPEGFSLMAPTRPLEIARSPILSAAGKARMAAELVIPRRTEGPEESLEEFVLRRFGRESFERLAQPMVGGIYGADPKKLSLVSTMPRFVDFEREHGSVTRGVMLRAREGAGGEGGASGARYGLFAAFRGGMATLVDALERALHEDIELGVAVTSVERADGGGYAVEVRGRVRDFDAVVIAVPAYVAGQVLGALSPGLAADLLRIEYASAATVTFSFDRSDIPHPLDAFGFVVPAVEQREILAATWASVKWPGRAPQGKALIRVFIGGYQGQHLVERADEELEAIARRELAELLGVRAAPEQHLVMRYLRAMPQYFVGHRELVGRIDDRLAELPQLELAGNAYHGVGIPDAVRSGLEAARKILGGQGG